MLIQGFRRLENCPKRMTATPRSGSAQPQIACEPLHMLEEATDSVQVRGCGNKGSSQDSVHSKEGGWMAVR